MPRMFQKDGIQRDSSVSSGGSRHRIQPEWSAKGLRQELSSSRSLEYRQRNEGFTQHGITNQTQTPSLPHRRQAHRPRGPRTPRAGPHAHRQSHQERLDQPAQVQAHGKPDRLADAEIGIAIGGLHLHFLQRPRGQPAWNPELTE